MTRKKFRLKKEPTKPLLKNFHGGQRETEVASTYDTIDPYKLVELLEEARESDPAAYFELETYYDGCFYESDHPSARLMLKWMGTTTEQFDKAIVLYKVDLKKYQAWYDGNKLAIEQELGFRKAEAKEAALRKADRLDRKAKAFRKKIS